MLCGCPRVMRGGWCIRATCSFELPFCFCLSVLLSEMTMIPRSPTFLWRYGYDILLGSIAAFYVIMVPYTKVEESFNIQVLFIISSYAFFFLVCFNRMEAYILGFEFPRKGFKKTKRVEVASCFSLSLCSLSPWYELKLLFFSWSSTVLDSCFGYRSKY